MSQQQQPQLPAIYVSRYSRRRTTKYPQCDNLQCTQREGGMGPGSQGVVCHPPIFYWEGRIRDPETRRERDANLVLCCFCAEQCIDANGQFSLYLIDTNQLEK